jgi:hypothetical protein
MVEWGDGDIGRAMFVAENRGSGVAEVDLSRPGSAVVAAAAPEGYSVAACDSL